MSERTTLDPATQPLDDEPRARVLVAGASGLTGSLAARLVWRHPRLELVAATSRSQHGRRFDELYPAHQVPLELGELDLDGADEVDAAIVALPHGAAAPVVAELRGLGAAVVDLSADFRIRDLPTYERWYAPHGVPELLGGRGVRADRAGARAGGRRRPGRQPRLLSDRRDPGAGAPCRGRPLRRRRRSMRSPERRARGAGPSTSTRSARTSGPTASTGTVTRPRSHRSCASWGRAGR